MGMSLWGVCGLFCCPPIPSKITDKIAFNPPKSTYSFDYDRNERNLMLNLHKKFSYQLTDKEIEHTEVFYVKTSRGNDLACLLINCVSRPKYIILFSHSNAVDIGMMSGYYYKLGQKMKCNFVNYDYSGYGQSSGKPSEKNIYADIEAVWDNLQMRFSLTPEKIILYGKSIGTVPTIDLASRTQPAGVILHSPLLSALRVPYPHLKRTWCCDTFINIDKINKITCPVFIIHGTDDEIVDFYHGYRLYQECACSVPPLFIRGAGHNNIELYSQFQERMVEFVKKEIKPKGRHTVIPHALDLHKKDDSVSKIPSTVEAEKRATYNVGTSSNKDEKDGESAKKNNIDLDLNKESSVEVHIPSPLESESQVLSQITILKKTNKDVLIKKTSNT